MKLGIDVGSTTVKLVLLNAQDEILYQKYERHMSSVFDKVRDLLDTNAAGDGGDGCTGCHHRLRRLGARR